MQSPISGLIVHQAKVLSGEVTVGEHAQAVVDIERRKSISRAHTATHMVHKAFREALGETATQAGSENAPGRFRFDFSAAGAVPASAMADVEARVNDLVLADLAVHAEVMTQEEARRSGAMALFGEKYGDEVRVVSVGDWARELCGGTHAGRSGQLGVIKLLGESSIGSGVRRVEALVGGDAYRFLAREHVLVAQLSEALKVRPEQLPERVNDIVEKLRTAEKEIERVRVAQLLAAAGQLAANPTDVFGVNFVGHRADGAGAGDVRKLALDIRGRMPAGKPSVVAIIGSTNGKPAVVVAVNDEARAWGVSANALVKVAATALGGSGGGKDDVAQAAAPTSPTPTRRCVTSSTRSDGPSPPDGPDLAVRRPARRGRGRRPDRRRPLRPLRHAGDPRGDRAPGRRRPRPDPRAGRGVRRGGGGRGAPALALGWRGARGGAGAGVRTGDCAGRGARVRSALRRAIEYGIG